jgi:hypothetical protein
MFNRDKINSYWYSKPYPIRGNLTIVWQQPIIIILTVKEAVSKGCIKITKNS